MIIISIAGIFQTFKLGGTKCTKIFKKLIMLAQALLCELCAKVIEFLKETITSQDFISRHKKSDQDFKRKRSLPFTTVVIFLINLLRSSIQNELDHFFKAINKSDIAQTQVTASAFCQARKKLKHSVFIELSTKAIEFFYYHFSPKTWKGFRLYAIDGSTVKVPRVDEVKEYFGAWNPARGESCPIARVSQMFDVMNHISVDTCITPKSIGERHLAAQHFKYIGWQDLILLDRGYPAFWLFHLILHKRAQFCARLPVHLWKVAQRFLASGLCEKMVTVYPPPMAKKMCEKFGLPATPLRLRLIRIELDGGDPEVLITSLIDQGTYPLKIFKELYHERWPIEECYKLFKSRIEVENFTGKSVEAVKQDFYARIFMANLTSILAFPLQNKIRENHKKSKYSYQINWTQALAKMKNAGFLLFIREKISPLIEQLHKIFITNLVPIRPGRKSPRKIQFQKRKFAFAYNRILKLNKFSRW